MQGSRPTGGVAVMTGDLNTKAGSDNNMLGYVLGKYIFGGCNIAKRFVSVASSALLLFTMILRLFYLVKSNEEGFIVFIQKLM